MQNPTGFTATHFEFECFAGDERRLAKTLRKNEPRISSGPPNMPTVSVPYPES
jgi:hypothetical protein